MEKNGPIDLTLASDKGYGLLLVTLDPVFFCNTSITIAKTLSR